MDVAPGTQIERYTVVQPLGTGGMATVWLARHTRLGSLHALKVLEIPSREVRERLVREGQVQGQIRHPNILSVTDVLEYRECPCLLMEVVAGPALDTYLEQRTPNLDQIDVLARGILAGVAAAHQAGLVHRDLKPANVLLQPDHRSVVPKIADFGLAKVLASPTSGQRTRSGMAMGTPAYMAPEQIRDASRVDTRADVFSLGALLYELGSGTRPFDGPDTFAIFQAVTSGRRRPIHDVAPWLPERMRSTIEAALQLDPLERPRDAGTLLRQWEGDTAQPENVWTEDELTTIRESGPRAVSETSFDEVAGETSAEPLPGSLSDPTFFETSDRDLEPSTWADPGAADPSAASLEPDTWADPGAADPSSPSLAPGTWADPGVVERSIEGPASEPTATPVAPTPGRRRAGALLIALALATGAAAAWTWQATRLQTAYTSHLVLRDGVFETASWSASPLDQPEQWRVTTQGGRVLEAMRINPQGYPLIQDGLWVERLPGLRQTWRDGRPEAWQLLSGAGAVVQHVALTAHDDTLELAVLDPADHAEPLRDSFALPFSSDQPRAELQLDADGRVTSATWLSAAGAPRPNDHGAYGARYTYTPDALIERVTHLGLSGDPTPNADGVQSEALTYDDHGLLVRQRLLGPGDVPLFGPKGYSAQEVLRTATGAVLGWRYLGPDGTPVLPNATVGLCAQYEGTRTATEHAYTCLDQDGEPTLSGDGWVTRQWTFDARGYPTDVRYFGHNGEPALHRMGEHHYELAYDDHGQLTRRGPFYDADGNLTFGNYSYGSMRRTVDDRGRVLETTWLDLDGKPMAGPDGAAVKQESWGDCSQPSEVRWFDAQGHPGYGQNKVHRVVWDERTDHNVDHRYFYGIDGQLTPSSDGVYQEVHTTNEHHDEVSVRYLGTQGEPVASTQRWATLDKRYDELGNEVERTYRDADGRLTATRTKPIARRVQVFDARRNPVRIERYGPNNTPVGSSPLGAAILEQRFDFAGRVLVQDLRTGDDEPLSGCSRVVHEYSPRGDETFLGCFDSANLPTRVPGSTWHAIVTDFDAHGRQIQVSYVNNKREPVVEGDLGYASQTRTFNDAHGSFVDVRLDTDMLPAKGLEWTMRRVDRDGSGRELAYSWFDAEGAPVNQGRGVAREEFVYNGLGNIIITRSYQADGTPGATSDGVFTIYDDYDAQGRWVHTKAIDGWGSPIFSPQRDSIESWYEHNEVGRVNARINGDGHGRRTNDADGVGIRRYQLDEMGLFVGHTYFTKDEEPTLATNGCHRLTMPHDRLGRMVEKRCYGIDGTPTNTVQGIHLVKTEWGTGENKRSMRFFNTVGEPVGGNNGVAEQTWRYDASDRLVESFCLDTEGARTVCDDGYATRSLRYDLSGNLVKDEWLDADGNPIDEGSK